MKQFIVTLSEELSGTYRCQAESQEEAEAIIEERYALQSIKAQNRVRKMNVVEVDEFSDVDKQYPLLKRKVITLNSILCVLLGITIGATLSIGLAALATAIV